MIILKIYENILENLRNTASLRTSLSKQIPIPKYYGRQIS